MTQNRWGVGLQPKGTKWVVEKFRESLAYKMARVESAKALMLLNGVNEELLNEVSAGKRIVAEIETLLEKFTEIHVADTLKMFTESFLNVVALQKLVHQHSAEVNPG